MKVVLTTCRSAHFFSRFDEEQRLSWSFQVVLDCKQASKRSKQNKRGEMPHPTLPKQETQIISKLLVYTFNKDQFRRNLRILTSCYPSLVQQNSIFSVGDVEPIQSASCLSLPLSLIDSGVLLFSLVLTMGDAFWAPQYRSLLAVPSSRLPQNQVQTCLYQLVH